MLTSVAFSVGIASVPMIGMAIGAEKIARARRIAWTAGLISFVSVGAIAVDRRGLPRPLGQHLHRMTQTCARRAGNICRRRRRCYAFIGLASSMYFSSQGAAKVMGPVLAQSARLLFIASGGWYLSTHDATPANFFTLAASSMVVLGTLSCSSVILTRWGPKRDTVAPIRPALMSNSSA